MSWRASVESWIGRVARWLRGRAASVWAALPERPRAWAEANGAQMGRVAASWARAAGERIAYGWLIWQAISPALSRRNGVVAEARRRLWEEVRANPAAQPHLRAPWAPWWLGPVRRFPVHARLLAALVALSGAVLSLGAEPVSALACAGSDLRACRDGLRGLTWVILAAQVTLLALLFPLVATLVPPMLGSRVSTSARVQLLLAHTEIVAAGASALALAFFAAILLTVSEGAAVERAIAFNALLTAWFALNLAGTAWFLARVLGLLTPSGRIAATLAYAASEAWPAEAAPKLADATLYRALRPDDSAGFATYEFGRSADKAAVTIDLPAPTRLAEVRLAVLDTVARAVARREGASAPTIVFGAPLDLSIECRREGMVVLAKASVPFTVIERWLIRRAYVFSTRPTVAEPLTGERLLHELATDSLDDLRSGNWPVLEERLGALAALHGFLLRLSSRRDANGSRHSYVTELMGRSDPSIGHSWARSHRSLVETVAARLPESRPAFRDLARLPARIEDEAGGSVPPAALMATDALLASLADRLYDRGAEVAGLATELGGVAKTPMQLPDAARDWYDEAWRDLSVAWEDVTWQRTPRPAAEATSERRWAECVEHAAALLRHLRSTSDLVAKAAVLGDLMGGRRTLDLLLRWAEPFSDDYGPRGGLYLEPGSIPVCVLERTEWHAAESVIAGRVPDGPLDPRSVFDTAVAEAWADEHVGLAAVLIEWALEAGEDSPAAELLSNLVLRKLYDEKAEGNGHSAADPFDISRLLRAIADASIADDRRPNMSLWRFRGIRRLRESAMVSGRAYSSSLSGTRSELLATTIAPLLVVLQVMRRPADWPVTPRSLGMVQPSLADEQVATFFLGIANAADALASSPAFSALCRRLAGPDGIIDERIARGRKVVRVRCKLIARAIRRRRMDAIRAAPIDQGRRNAVSNAAESLAFAQETAGPPVSLFPVVERAPGEQPLRFGIRMPHSRGSLTEPLLEPPVGNEADWWAQKMRDHLAEQVCSQLRNRVGQPVAVESPKAWRDVVAEGIRRIRDAGGTPLLLYGRDWPGRWVRESELGAATLERLNRTEVRDWAKVRTPFLDGVQIARLPVAGPTFVVPETLFRRIVFGETEGRIVTVEFTEDPKEPAQGTLTARGSFDLELDRLELTLVIEARIPPA